MGSKSIAVDTSAFSLLLRGDRQVTDAISRAEQVAVPIAVIAELRAGFLHGKKTKQYGAILDDFLADGSVVVLHITLDTIPIYAELYAYARANGKQLSNNDLWIAALCIQYSLPLLTTDKDFQALPQLRKV